MNTDSIRKYLEEHLSEKRRTHIEGVRSTAVRLSEIFGEDPKKAEICALFHDMFKERDLDDLVRKYHLPDKYLGNRNLAHSKVASAVMRSEYGITDEDMLNAVSFHTTGRPGMSKLEQILFLADATEPNRQDYPGLKEIREASLKDLDLACYLCLKRSVEYVREKGGEVDKDSVLAEEYYKKQLKEKEMESKTVALEAAKALDKKLGQNILVIDVAGKSSFADYLVICGAGSERQAESLADEVEEHLADMGELVRGKEGRGSSGWILIDYGDVVVNVFTKEAREKYKIEEIWGDCEQVPFNGVED
ncbi:MAG: bis(5'-nucleosyl)-tetraphosphatase (symmetrical) YqeK [Eubacteriales bacterium]|nr:bis(5'-nucleosyl)-tetraphosphatase (symmetrical) YqeK [Eubacteriales bacterium]